MMEPHFKGNWLVYITDILPRVVYFTLMFDILPACG